MTPLRASMMLPARRAPVTLVTDDGLHLVGELALPLDREPVATLLTLHPLPTHGGMMDSHVLRKASWRLPALASIAVLRFNTRGTSSPAGTSEGAFDRARGEQSDLRAALGLLDERHLPNIWLLAWSFGTDLALKYGLLPGVEGAVLLSPPLRYTGDDELDAWARDGRPLIVLVPEHDDFLKPDEARRRLARVPQTHLVEVPGAGHLWVGERAVTRVLDEVVSAVAPDRAPLPREWRGAFETVTVP